MKINQFIQVLQEHMRKKSFSVNKISVNKPIKYPLPFDDFFQKRGWVFYRKFPNYLQKQYNFKTPEIIDKSNFQSTEAKEIQTALHCESLSKKISLKWEKRMKRRYTGFTYLLSITCAFVNINFGYRRGSSAAWKPSARKL